MHTERSLVRLRRAFCLLISEPFGVIVVTLTVALQSLAYFLLQRGRQSQSHETQLAMHLWLKQHQLSPLSLRKTQSRIGCVRVIPWVRQPNKFPGQKTSAEATTFEEETLASSK